MTPKEKAKDLVDKFDKAVNTHTNTPLKQCALIAVDLILNTRPGSPYPQDVGLVVNGIYNIINYPKKYWEEVKQEINKL